jgi:hypothetical protein
MLRIVVICMAIASGTAALAQARSAEDKALFILHISDFAKRYELNRDLRTVAIAQAIQANAALAAKMTPEVSRKVAALITRSFAASKEEFERLAARSLVNRLSSEELDALYRFYSSTVGLSAGTKLQWALTNETVSEQGLNRYFWPKLRAEFAREPELRFILGN